MEPTASSLPFLTVPLRGEQDVLTARTRAAQLGSTLHLGVNARTRFATAVSELARNAVMYARGGVVAFGVDPQARLVWARVSDTGPGIAALDAILAGHYRSKTGLGAGLSGTRRLVDAFDIHSHAQGTRIQVGQRVPASVDLTAAALTARLAALGKPEPEPPQVALEAQNQILMSTLAELTRRESQLSELNLELEETNRGTLALYSDLEAKAEQLRAAEHELRALNAHLTERVQERTARLAELNAEMTAYARSFSQDIQEPLRRVHGFLALLRRHLAGHVDSTLDHYLTVIAAESGRVGKLAEHLADFKHEGEREPRRDRVPLDVLIMQVRSDLAPVTRGRRVDWRIASLPTVVGDALMLRAAFTQILHNALKFSAVRDRALIEVGSDRQGEEVTVWIRDNGVGFPDTEAARIFDLFQRLHGEEYSGAGLGLTSVRRVVTRHGGRVWAEGRPGEGATVFLALPVAGAHDPVPDGHRR
ncbi:ATP-binding protein [Deinococcus sp. KSM4-11]|uniref:sensor histidine kinase n=1 Tax=Deinococcus sp. KSM4-11 TaxID=2568654 RepID=UPI001F1115AA|nr:ATP-binding protein [Deinococcus sp. KSM4-11]